MVDLKDPNVVQTEAICMEAVKEYGFALQFVKKQTEAICMEAIKQNGFLLQYVKNQTEAICICAVRQNAWALQFVHNQTEAICIEAVKRNGHTLVYVENQTDTICLVAFAFNIDIYEMFNVITYPSPQFIRRLLKLYPAYSDSIMTKSAIDLMKTYKICSDEICNSLPPHVSDIFYRPNNICALPSRTRWYTTTDCSKTVFLMI